MASLRTVVPAAWALAGFAAVGIVAVATLPELSSVLPRGDDPEPNPTQVATTALAMLLLTGAYLFVVASSTAELTLPVLAPMFGYNAGIVVLKFVLSPAAYHNSAETTLAEYLWIGLAVMVIYAAALAAIHAVARRNRAPRAWSWPSKLTVVAGVLAFALVSRLLAALVLGRATEDYLRNVFQGAGLWLPTTIVVVALLAVEAFDRAGHPVDGDTGALPLLRTSLLTGLGLIAVYHGLWAILMVRLFS